MWFWICVICGWVILSFPLGILIGRIFKLGEPSACTGNCNQGRNCTCENKND